jgi:hypothetical protein
VLIIVTSIKQQMTVPLVQGALRYSYKADPAVSPVGTKERAEGWAFASAVLPQVAACHPVSAKIIERNMRYDNNNTMGDGHKVVFAAFRDAYTCMGITCASIGGLNEGGGAVTAACDESSLLPSATARMSGYLPGSDVVQHSQMDKDLVGMEVYLKAGDFANAQKLYSYGKNSLKSSSVRSLAGFHGTILKGEPLADIYANYWGGYDYAHTFVMNALAAFGMEDSVRVQLALKGAQYQSMWMYVVHEMVDAVGDCKGANIKDNDKGVHAWDEAWAFYAGSLGGAGGASVYALAEKRCVNFGTCEKGTAGVNIQLLDLFTQGKELLEKGKCADADALIQPIVAQMTVPLVQGALRYAYRADPTVGSSGAKDRAEGWAFVAAVLPQIANVDAKAAATIRSNMEFGSTAYLADGYKAMFSAFQSVYEGLGITCEEVGGLDGAHACHGGEEAPGYEIKQEKRIIQLEEQLTAVNGGGNVGLWALVALNLAITLLMVGYAGHARCSKKTSHMRLEAEEPEVALVSV